MPKGTILYVEDEEADAFFMNRAFQKQGFAPALRVLSDGRQALDYLAGKPPYEDRMQTPLPVVLLLDVKLPYVSGFEILRWLRQQPELKSLPVVMFSSSAHAADRDKAKELGANAYIPKPGSAAQFVEVVKLLALWLRWEGRGITAEGSARAELKLSEGSFFVSRSDVG